MSSALDLSPGAIFADQFRVVGPLARGGMGAVYVVEQLGTARERALKLMHPMLVSDERSVERFTREARVASRIESDHVVEVIAAGVEPRSGTPWLCMELLKGETLDARVERAGRLSVAETLEVVRQLGHALAAAHRAGIVHRDLKPENVFLATPRREGIPFTLKVLDFGVAALVQAGSASDGTSGGGPKTTQGVGSPMWMAPEQTNVGHVTCATDVWALGLIAFFLLTGKSYWRAPTIQGSSITALLVEIMVEPLVPASVRAEQLLASGLLPPGFDTWFMRSVARDPGQRYPDAAGAVADLVALLEAHQRGAPAPTFGGASGAPAAFAETAAMPGTPSVPPRFASQAPVATQPLAGHVVTGQTVGAGVGQPVVAQPLAPAAPPRRWPWLLVGALTAIGVCGGGGVLVLLGGLWTVGDDLASLPPPEVRSGGDIHIGRDGVEAHSSDGDHISVTLDGIAVDPGPVEAAGTEDQADPGEADSDEADSDEADSDEADSDEGDEDDDEGDDDSDDEGEPETEPVAPRRPRPVRASAAATIARRSVIDPCWRGTFEGETPPAPARWDFLFALGATNTATNVRITGPTGGPYSSFRSCVVSHVGQFTSPDGDGHVVVTLP